MQALARTRNQSGAHDSLARSPSPSLSRAIAIELDRELAQVPRGRTSVVVPPDHRSDSLSARCATSFVRQMCLLVLRARV